MAGNETLLLGQAEVARTMRLPDYIDAVEDAFRRLGEGRVTVPGVVHMAAPDGTFHIKSAAFLGEPHYVAVKVNGNFPDNRQKNGLPTIQGAIILCDGRNGSLLAVIDTGEVTAMRTGAATAVAAKHLAPPDTAVATVIGCGIQGRVQMLALQAVLPVVTVYAFDLDRQRCEAFAARMRDETGLDVIAVDELADATRASQAIVTCTSSRKPFLGREHVSPGTFIAAVGADNADKQELHAELLRQSKLVVDLIDQCAEMGELHHALDAGVMQRSDVYAELSQVVARSGQPGMRTDDIVIFDSTGTAIQDVAAAGMIYERAKARGIGTAMRFA
ncbi:MAG: ornithine cyclodeaminase family protein [Woeseiaceae bacterium]|nr:ornithine cyclodeaminase family protein [Woeseiaceae bacterium]